MGDAEAKAGELLLEVLLAEDAGGAVRAAGGAVDDGVEVDRRAGELGGGGDEAGLHLTGADALADDEVAKDATPVRGLVWRQALLAGPFADLVAGRVVALGGEVAVVDVDDAAPVAAGVEAEGELAARLAERVLELVAVAPLAAAGTIGSVSKPSRPPRRRSASSTCSALSSSWRSYGSPCHGAPGHGSPSWTQVSAMRSGLGSMSSTADASA